MAKAASGYTIGPNEVPTILGMDARGDRDHDIAAWFGVNQGRIAEAKDGKWGSPAPAVVAQLPPRGAPGIKGRRLRQALDGVLAAMLTDPKGAESLLNEALSNYDADEP